MRNNKLTFSFLIALATIPSALSAMSWQWRAQEKPVAKQIITAIEKGDTKALFEIQVMQGVDFNRAIPYQKHYATVSGQLLPIEIAILENQPAVVEFLLKNGANANKRSAPDATLIGLAIHHNAQGQCDPIIIESLLNHGADAAAYNFDGYNALHSYCAQERPLARIIERLSDKAGIENCIRNAYRHNEAAPLHIAVFDMVYADHATVCLETLLRIGASPNPVDSLNRTPLDFVLESWNLLRSQLSRKNHTSHSLRISNCQSAARLLLIHGAHANRSDINAHFTQEELDEINLEIAEHKRILHEQLAAHTPLPHELCDMTVNYCDPCFYQEQKEAGLSAHDHRNCVIS